MFIYSSLFYDGISHNLKYTGYKIPNQHFLE